MSKQKKVLGNIFVDKVSKNPKSPAIGWITKNKVNHMNNQKYKEIVESISLGLTNVGLKAEDKLSILGSTNKEWHFCDIATLCSAGIVIPIYPSYLADEVEYIINHSETKILIVENDSQLLKAIEVQSKLKTLKIIISICKIKSEYIEQLNNKIKFYQLDEIIKIGDKQRAENANQFTDTINSISEEQIATIIYTSGTTGEPKGAVITHHAFCSMLSNLKSYLKNNIDQHDRTLTFLPLSHVLGRCDSMLNFIFGLENIYAESIDKIIDNLALAKPTVMVAVPRIFEKVYAKVMGTIDSGNFIKKSLFDWAQTASNQYFEKLDRDLSPTTVEMLQRELAYKLVFSKIYDRFGGNIRFFVSGGAPLSSDISKFLRNANLSILEGYGLTETIAPCSLTPPSKQVPGTVGLPIGDVQFKFAEDGEIMVKTASLFSGYYKNEEETNQVFNGDWFLTGDIGILTNDGHLKITDRKKDIIITSGGKNVAPQKIENIMKTKSYISNFMVVGDQKKYLTAIVAIEKIVFENIFSELGLEHDCTIKDLSNNARVKELIQENIDEGNIELASYETIKKFHIAPIDFTVESGMVTPSLKLKKKVINQEYSPQIDAMYK